MDNFIFGLFMLLVFIGFILLAIAILRIPIMIADARGITGENRKTIVLLSWLGLILGITWIIALVFSLVWGEDTSSDNLDKLDKLSRLYKSKAITKSEYEKMKKKLLKDA